MQSKLKTHNAKVRFRNNAIAARVFTGFGWLVLATFLVLILHILSNAVPLLYTPKLSFQSSVSISELTDVIGVRESAERTIIYSQENCALVVSSVIQDKVEKLSHHRVTCDSELVMLDASSEINHGYVVISPNGLVELYRLNITGTRVESTRFTSFDLSSLILGVIKSDHNQQWQANLTQGRVHLWTKGQNKGIRVYQFDINQLEEAEVFDYPDAQFYLPLAKYHQHLIKTGEQVLIYDDAQVLLQNVELGANQALIPMTNQRGFFLFEQHSYSVWGIVNHQGNFIFKQLNRFENAEVGNVLHMDFDPHTGALYFISDTNELLLLNPNTFELVSKQSLRTKVTGIFASTSRVILVGENKIMFYLPENLQGVVTWKSLFSEVQYIGYETPGFIWQTSVVDGNDQAKFSLVPLIIGSIKASVLSLFVAVPLGLGAAVFTAFFASNETRAILKPSIEMIEAIPAVIIGFIAAVWLAPFAEKSLLALLMMLLCMPMVFLAMIFIHSSIKTRHEDFTQSIFYICLMTGFFALALFALFSLAQGLQALLLTQPESLFTQIMTSVTLTKSSIVVALALGIAITPTIYTLVDDAIHDVPDGAKHAAFALGATEVQTLFRVVLVVAQPSIISAIMLGFGRAFGETMIVLMVTGNTPVADWDLLSGLRSLTSNLTIELQESSQGSTHFHILFLTAAILFAFTFVINTLASMFKNRLSWKNNNG
ncbi:ABC transporter permease subunit [Glaciecola sp. 1036]|uniref:ABC transporter permease subunit n=1 Tax=Alteromonadaceae TaxID=72275 RepID=UPI003D04CBC0